MGQYFKNLLKNIFNLSHLNRFIPVLLILVYFPGVIISFFRIGQTSENYEFLLIFSFSLLTYFISYQFFNLALNKKFVVKQGVSEIFLAKVTYIIYFVFIIYTVVTAPAIPLFESFRGATSNDLSNYRELFLKGRKGLESILVYLNAIFTVALLPFLTASLYLSKYRYRHILLLLFVFTLLLSMEKSLIARALLPLLILVVNKQINDKFLSLRNLLLLSSVGLLLVTFLALGKFSNDETILLSELLDSDPIAAKYFIVSNPDNVVLFIINRVFWIPYITAIDWLEYFNTVLHRDLVLGASSSVLSVIFGMERINLERLVFEFEWGQNQSGTGSANTVYFIDIFLNFGWLGVFLSNILLAFIVRLFEISNNKAAQAAFIVFAYFIATSSLLAVLFSTGLLFLICIIFISKRKYD